MLSVSARQLRARLLRIGSAFALVAATAGVCSGQAAPAAIGSGPAMSRLDIFGGYLYFKPVQGSAVASVKYETIGGGGLFNASYHITRHYGVEAEGGYAPQSSTDTHCLVTVQGGPVARLQRGRFVPFVHVLGGLAQIGGPGAQPCDYKGFGVTGGGGLDYVLPIFHNRIAVRPIQADYTFSHIVLKPSGVGDIYAVRLSAGLTFRFGSESGGARSESATTLTCSADPAEPLPGEPVTLTAQALDLKIVRDLAYLWSASGGTVTGHEATATLDTKGLPPGTYNVSGHLVHGPQAREIASCTTAFTIRSPLPPTVACSADQHAINSGTPVNITTVASSPGGRPLTYSYTSTNGQVTGNGATAVLSTAGSTPGTITVTCRVTDDKGMSAAATASVVIATPAAPPPAAAARNLCSFTFDRDGRRPDRVDNEAKGCLDDIALTMNRETASKLVLIGNHAGRETTRDGAERVLNAADYLVKEKGIDPARIELRTGDTPQRIVTTTIVPPGATFDGAAAATFDRTKIVRHGQAYGVPGQRSTTVHKRRRRHHTSAVVAAPQ